MANQGTNIEVLLVEDSAPEALLTAAQLQDAAGGGVDLAHESSLTAAMAHLAEREPDVVLLDPRLPDALRAASVSRLRAGWPDVPVVVLTGNDDPELAEEMLAAGADACLSKSEADGADILRAVNEAARHRLLAEIERLRDSEAR